MAEYVNLPMAYICDTNYGGENGAVICDMEMEKSLRRKPVCNTKTGGQLLTQLQQKPQMAVSEKGCVGERQIVMKWLVVWRVVSRLRTQNLRCCLRELAEQWRLYVPGWDQLPACFKGTVPYLLASVVFHRTWLKENLSGNTECPSWWFGNASLNGGPFRFITPTT
jgi:hypothetical protein